MFFSDLALSRRLERAEGHACLEFAEARRHLYPSSAAEWIECAGAYAVFDGAESPVTQSFGLGIFEELSGTTLDRIERFFFDCGAPVNHEISPLAGVGAMNLLCARGYRPIEISSVMYQQIGKGETELSIGIATRVTNPDEAQLWAEISADGWAQERPEFRDFILNLGGIAAARKQSICFLAEIDGTPGAAGVLCLHEGVALLGGAATVPKMRRRGLQAALLQTRLIYAYQHGCDLAMMVAEAGSESQRNAERKGFKIAYTRTKWRLDS